MRWLYFKELVNDLIGIFNVFMTRIRDRSRDEDHGLQIDKISLAYVKHFGIGCYLMYDL